MVSMLDCIKRVPEVLNAIIENCDTYFSSLFEIYSSRINDIDELVFIGSGTSLNSGITARYLAEETSGIRVTVTSPSEFLYHLKVRNKNALYIFISQTGTSILTGKALKFAKDNGFMNTAVSESALTPLATQADAFIDMGCGDEEYPMRTIGYSSTVLTLMLLGVELGKKRGFLSNTQYNEYIKQARLAAQNIPEIISKTMLWLDKNRRNMLRADGIFFCGSGALYGVALEGAIKVWETPQIISAGYELEEGIHGPNFGFNHRHCVIVLNDGAFENNKAVALGRYMHMEKQNGFIIGASAQFDSDLPLDIKGSGFACLEFAATVQVIAYHLATEQGRDLFAPHDNSVMESYFKSHD